MPAVIVKNSAIHGRGVFATRDLQAGELLIDWHECSGNLTSAAVEKLSVETRKRVSFIDGEFVLFKPPACFVNHSCEANARGENKRDVAVRPIKKDEEITVNYVLEKVPGLNFPCNCGSPNCLGFLKS